MIRLFFVLAAIVAGAFLLSAQVAPAPGQQPSGTTIRATTQEVLLDMIFRDKKGRPVKDIRADEIEILDDGARQKLNSFRLVEGIPAAKARAEGGAPPLDPMREIRLVTLVFENLDADGKRFFRAATKDMLELAPEPNLYFSVFTVDQRLHCLQPFTTDHKVLQTGVDRAITYNSLNQVVNASDQVKASLSRIVDNPVSLQGGAPPSQGSIGDFVNYTLAKMQFDMLQFAEAADRADGARASLFALQNLVREQAKLPGRKAVLYFNPWLNIPEFMQELFRDVVNTANRSNVSFYTVDTKGLVTWSQGGGGRDAIAGAARESKAQQDKGGAGAVTTGQARVFDTLQSGLRANPQLALKELAESTGGFMVADTNDWRAPLRMVMDEVRTYYEAAYSPQIEAFDGKFRKIAVKVNRPEVTVHTRNGYFALPTMKGGQQLLAFEMPLLNALNQVPAAHDVAFRARAHRFSRRGPNVEYMLTVEVPMKGLNFQPRPEKKTASAQASLMTVVKDEQGDIVAKFSKDFPLEVPLEKLDAYQAGVLTQTFRTELPPGRHSLAVIVVDRQVNKTGVTSAELVAPGPSQKLSMSELVVVRRNDVLRDNAILDAFYYEGGKIVPTLAEALKGGAGQALPFYFSVYPDPAVQQPPELTMSFYLEGQLLGSASAPLPKPEKSGRIAYIANIPADAFTSGKYELRATVKQGDASVEERIAFAIE
ncbi:MAG TPA: VWA domain-containing protein [Bryobacteraceae bacterium]|nr:VWA domain-containing protein [Bryobacteraceae bacterium]